ncbi:phosphonate C-P lyase system protein PhnH [Chelativorans xinjiangense]|uniref:phosphonate C-P lyase system protein PhnH n=1 Tax=Chelativorans xinjiangense TaxID=2681485 RepID=UPI001FE74352|nr:phosphonate C-P lyase system protein PhnH [Chelativorans xinjiangense]
MNDGNATLAAPDMEGLKPGFTEPVFEAQEAFRTVLNTLSYAGRVHTLETELDPPAPLDPAMAAMALTLFDFDTPVWLDAAIADGAAPDFLRFHCGAPLVAAEGEARFAVVANLSKMPPLDRFAIGEDRYPDRSATLLIQVPSLTGGPAMTWRGPGIDGAITVAIAGLPADFWAQWADNHALYPLGVDVIFAAGRALVGLPRGIQVEG